MASPARTRPKKGRSRRPPRSALLRRWLAVGAVFLFAYLYCRSEVERASVTVASLQQEEKALQRQLQLQRSDAALTREARRLGFVRPGERLYIVKGIAEWRRAQAARSSLRDDG